MLSHTFLMIFEHLVGAPSAPARVGMEIASFVRGGPSLPVLLFPHSHATFPRTQCRRTSTSDTPLATGRPLGNVWVEEGRLRSVSLFNVCATSSRDFMFVKSMLRMRLEDNLRHPTAL